VAETVLKNIGAMEARLDFMPPLPQGSHLVKTTILHPRIHENPSFTGRKELLSQLLGPLHPRPGSPSIISNSQESARGDSGLAGVGKSTLAREFAWRQRANYDGVWWINSSSRSTIIQSLLELGERLSPPVNAIESREKGAAMVIEALETRRMDKPWLLIYDNVANDRLLENLLPQSGAEALITSRWSDIYGYRNKVDIDVFPPELAVWHLGNLSSDNDPEAASALAASLGNLPLSLRLAGSHCRARNLSLSSYHSRFGRMMSERPRLQKAPWKHADSLYVAFNMALDAIIDGDIEKNVMPQKLAAILMGVMAYYDSEAIPLDIFQTALTSFPGYLSASATSCIHSSRHFDSHSHRSITPYGGKAGAGGHGEGGAGDIVFMVDGKDLSEAVMALVDFGLVEQVEMAGGQPGLSVHWLAQEMMRGRLAEEGREDAMAGLATGLLAQAFPGGLEEGDDPGNEASWPRCARLLPHVMALFEHLPPDGELASPSSQQQKAGMGGREVAILFNQAGLYLKARGDIEEAEKLLRRGLEINRATYGVEHEYLAVSLNNLAAALQEKGWLFEAEPLYMQALKIDEARKGRNHPDVARDLFNLAILYQAMGNDNNEVETLLHRALQITAKKFGNNHPNVAIILNAMGRLYENTGRRKDAEHLYRRALVIDRKFYGRSHPYVARDMEALAHLLARLGRGREAREFYVGLLRIDEKTLGPDHPDIAANLNNLAVLIEENEGDYQQSEKLKRRALLIDENSFGPNHPNVARDLNNLALLFKATGRLDEAEPALRRTVDIFERSYGPDHQSVATALNNLADLLRESGRLEEAESLYMRALRIDERKYGPEHNSIARDCNNLALLLKTSGRPREAYVFARRALAVLEKILDEGHPWLGKARSNLAAIQADIDVVNDKSGASSWPVQDLNVAPASFESAQMEGNELWEMFDEEARKRGGVINPLKGKLGSILRKKDGKQDG
jgi:tetratricopeptide (TPR) repeat protein